MALPARPLRVLHLTGSAVSDFYADLSRLYARDCLAATADPGRYDVLIAHVSPDGRWCFPEDLSREGIAAVPTLSAGEAIERVAGLAVDVMVPQMFCLPGMTSYRALFDVLGIPFVGNTADVMALGAHKARARAVVAASGVAVPHGELLRRGQEPTIGPPAVVKPATADNSLGVSLVRDTADYSAALEAAFEHADEVLVEDYVELGREVRCGIVVRGGELVCLPLEEYAVDAVSKPIRDHGDKITPLADGELGLVAKNRSKAWILDPSDPVTGQVWEAARACHLAMGARHYSLFDFRVDPAGRPWFLEASLYCSFAEQSVLAVMAAAAGTNVRELLREAIAEALG